METSTESYVQAHVRRAIMREEERQSRWEELRSRARRMADRLRALFGSVCDPDRFRLDSDLDLAVEGLTPGEYWEAWAELEVLAQDAAFDIVRVETASDFSAEKDPGGRRGADLIAREREARRLRTLIGRLREDWQLVERIHERVQEAVTRVAREKPDPIHVAAVALFLQHGCTSIELDGSLPAGEDWHRELVEQMTVEIPGIRSIDSRPS